MFKFVTKFLFLSTLVGKVRIGRIIFIIIFCSFSQNAFWSCSYNWDIWSSLSSCLSWTPLVQPPTEGNLLINDWLKGKINDWTINIATLLSLVAVWSIVFGSFKMVISGWEDDALKKWKDIVKWWILWFLLIVSAWWIVKLITEVIYSLAW